MRKFRSRQLDRGGKAGGAYAAGGARALVLRAVGERAGHGGRLGADDGGDGRAEDLDEDHADDFEDDDVEGDVTMTMRSGLGADDSSSSAGGDDAAVNLQQGAKRAAQGLESSASSDAEGALPIAAS